MTASWRRPAAQPRPGRRRRVDASDDFYSHEAAPDDSPLSSNTALSPCAPPSRAPTPQPPLRTPCLNGRRRGGAATAAAANSRGGSSQPAATGSPIPGPDDETGGAQDPAATFGAAAAAVAANTCPTVRPALGADLPSHPRQPGLRPDRQRSAIRPCERSFPCCYCIWRYRACYQS